MHERYPHIHTAALPTSCRNVGSGKGIGREESEGREAGAGQGEPMFVAERKTGSKLTRICLPPSSTQAVLVIAEDRLGSSGAKMSWAESLPNPRAPLMKSLQMTGCHGNIF